MPEKLVVTVSRRTIKRGKYKKKERIELTEQQRRNYRITYDVLNGATFEEAAKLHGMNSAQAAQKQFRLTVINFFLPYRQPEIIKKNYDIKFLRRLWTDTKL